jgi:hypothetical protein
MFHYTNLNEAKEEIGEVGQTIDRNGLPEALVPLIVGFTGYKIYDEQNETHFFIGVCLYVKITVI